MVFIQFLWILHLNVDIQIFSTAFALWSPPVHIFLWSKHLLLFLTLTSTKVKRILYFQIRKDSKFILPFDKQNLHCTISETYSKEPVFVGSVYVTHALKKVECFSNKQYISEISKSVIFEIGYEPWKRLNLMKLLIDAQNRYMQRAKRKFADLYYKICIDNFYIWFSGEISHILVISGRVS